MSRAALAEKRPFLLGAILAALAYHFARGGELPGLYLILLKGAGVGMLAAYAALRHQGADARQLAVALGFAALGDMAIELDLVAGALLFFLFHVMALGLFLKHRRGPMQGRDAWICGLLVTAVPLAAWLLPADRGTAIEAALYALALGAMVAGAWASDFPRTRVGAGALLFVASDLLLLAGLGPLAQSPLADQLVWPIYFLGMLLIATGVITTLAKREPRLRLVR